MHDTRDDYMSDPIAASTTISRCFLHDFAAVPLV